MLLLSLLKLLTVFFSASTNSRIAVIRINTTKLLTLLGGSWDLRTTSKQGHNPTYKCSSLFKPCWKDQEQGDNPGHK